MAEQVRVVDADAPAHASPSPATRGNWLLFALGFVVGLGVAVVFTTPAGVTTVTTTVHQVSSPVDPVEPGESPTPGIGEVVEGFPDAMVALVETQSGGLTHLLWPVAGTPVERPLPAGSGPARFDTSGRWIASMTSVPDQMGSVLSVGITSRFSPLTSGVTSFAWHDSEAAELAYTKTAEGEGQLWVVPANRNSALIVDGLDPIVAVSSWGDWGFALNDPVEGEVLLYTPNGDFRAVVPGVAYGSHPSGWIVAYDGGLMLVSAGGGISRFDADLAQAGAVMNAEFSPDRSFVAVRGDLGLLVLDAEDGSTLIYSEKPGSEHDRDMAWSSDSRFVFLPYSRGRGVLLADVESGSITPLLRLKSVASVGVIPLSHFVN